MVKRRFFTFYAAKVQQKMHICKNFAQKFTFECKIFANGLHNATVLSGECASQAASEGTTVSLFAGAKPSNGLCIMRPYFRGNALHAGGVRRYNSVAFCGGKALKWAA